MEIVLPTEMGVYSLRTILESEIPKADWLQSKYDQLCMLDEKILKALYHIQGYQRRLRKAFDKKVRNRDLKLGDLVLKEIWAPIQDANILWGSNKIDGLRCKSFYQANQHGSIEKKYNFWGGSMKTPRMKWL